MSQRGHHKWGRLPFSTMSILSRMWRCKNSTRNPICVASLPWNPLTWHSRVLLKRRKRLPRRGGVPTVRLNQKHAEFDGAPPVNLQPGSLHNLNTRAGVTGGCGVLRLPLKSNAHNIPSIISQLHGRGNKVSQPSSLHFYETPLFKTALQGCYRHP